MLIGEVQVQLSLYFWPLHVMDLSPYTLCAMSRVMEDFRATNMHARLHIGNGAQHSTDHVSHRNNDHILNTTFSNGELRVSEVYGPAL